MRLRNCCLRISLLRKRTDQVSIEAAAELLRAGSHTFTRDFPIDVCHAVNLLSKALAKMPRGDPVTVGDTQCLAPTSVDYQIPFLLRARSLWPKRRVDDVAASTIDVMDTRLADLIDAEFHLQHGVAISK